MFKRYPEPTVGGVFLVTFELKCSLANSLLDDVSVEMYMCIYINMNIYPMVNLYS